MSSLQATYFKLHSCRIRLIRMKKPEYLNFYSSFILYLTISKQDSDQSSKVSVFYKFKKYLYSLNRLSCHSFWICHCLPSPASWSNRFNLISHNGFLHNVYIVLLISSLFLADRWLALILLLFNSFIALTSLLPADKWLPSVNNKRECICL